MKAHDLKALTALASAGEALHAKDPEHMFVIDGPTYLAMARLAVRCAEERQRLLDALRLLGVATASGMMASAANSALAFADEQLQTKGQLEPQPDRGKEGDANRHNAPP